ncbi:MAG: hypothetical protein U0L05_06130 [Schaedlerella sp.]|nr:hypothetical protein [Schaedlerella sp.]
MNIGNMMKMQAALSQFNKNHPRVAPFLKAVQVDGIRSGTIIEITVTTPEGAARTANIKVQESDLELLRSLSEMNK